jgi:hypothetical protein
MDSKNMAKEVYLMDNSGGGVHEVEGETGQQHGESANNAAPPRFEVLGGDSKVFVATTIGWR